MSVIGLIDADLISGGTLFPNLTLLKLSGYYKDKGYTVKLLNDYSHLDKYEHVYISKVFTYSKYPKYVLSLPNVSYGGTGFFEDGGGSLPYDIEHHMPDYTLYDEYILKKIENGSKKTDYKMYQNFSIGFTTRGCFRKCSFCVNKKYDHVVEHSPLNEFVDTNRKYVCLLDDNILAFKGWRKVFSDLQALDKPFQFKQGLDIRLLTEEKATILSNSNYYGDYIFAFDDIDDKELIIKKLKLWRSCCSKKTKLYVLCAYKSQDSEDIRSLLERIQILLDFDCSPFVMKYASYKNSKWVHLYTAIARWCNQQQFIRRMSLREFCYSDQSRILTQGKVCASLKALNEFEQKYPDIAKQYFDIKRIR